MDGYCLSPYACKCCTVFKQFDGLNFDGLVEKHQKRQNFPPSKFSAIWYVSNKMKCLSYKGGCGVTHIEAFKRRADLSCI